MTVAVLEVADEEVVEERGRAVALTGAEEVVVKAPAMAVA